jgi:hypothetical protein
MFITPQINFKSSAPAVIKFQGIHFEKVSGSVLVGDIPNTKIGVYVTNDGGNTDMNQPGSHKARFEDVKESCDILIKCHKPEKATKLLEDYKAYLFNEAQILLSTGSPHIEKKTADPPTHIEKSVAPSSTSKSHKKKQKPTYSRSSTILKGAVVGLALSAAFHNPQP